MHPRSLTDAAVNQWVALARANKDALEVVAATDYLGVVVEVENEVARLHRKLGFDHPSGGEDGR
jgi:hypothetical protein